MSAQTPSPQPEKLHLAPFDLAAHTRSELLAALKERLPQALHSALAEVLPAALTEGGQVDFQRLQLALGQDPYVPQERYGMNWPGKADCFATMQAPSVATLRPARGESVRFDETENVMIEGDNLEVLKLLQKAYIGKIKLIYIDPPYNTGHEFIYPDNYSETLDTYLEYTGQIDSEGGRFGTNTESEGRFHSKWLNMMYPRLFLARNLLREDGVIFISIDDSEVTNLRCLCDEIFGEENFVACLVYDKNRKNDAKFFSVGHEYIIAYLKSAISVSESGTIFRMFKEGINEVKDEFQRLRAEHHDDWEKVIEGLKKLYASWPENDDRKSLARYTRVDENGPYRDDGNISWPGGGGPRYNVFHPITKKPCKIPKRGWIYPTSQRMQEEIAKGRVVFGIDESTSPRIRSNLFESDKEVMRSVHYSYAQTATVEFQKLFDNIKVFDNPKHYEDIKKLVEYVTTKSDSDLILDFFAGSCTTAHAVLQLNEEDGGNRKFITVQLPEPCDPKSEAAKAGYQTIFNIGTERVRRVITKLDKETAAKTAQQEVQLELSDATKPQLPSPCPPPRGFKVFKLATSNFKLWNAQPPIDLEETNLYENLDSEAAKLARERLEEQLELHINHLKSERTPEDLLYEILLGCGFPLHTPIEKKTMCDKAVYSIENGLLFITLEKQLTQDFIEAMAAAHPIQLICLDEGFQNNDQLKTNAALLMEAQKVVRFQTI